jgi:hypothetical protein
MILPSLTSHARRPSPDAYVGVAFDQESFDAAVSVRVAGDLSQDRHLGMAGNHRFEGRGQGGHAALSPRVELSAPAVKKDVLGQPQDASSGEYLLRSSWPIEPDEPIDSVERLSSGTHGKHAVNV